MQRENESSPEGTANTNPTRVVQRRKTSLGYLRVESTIRGVCRVVIEDADDGVAAESDGPKANGASVDNARAAAGHEALQKIAQWIEEPRAQLQVNVDIGGTAFQRRVWDALRAIPSGETRSYAEVARAIGAPRATRAVAQACGANPVALVIPCHRVVRSDGGLGGFRWGIERKRALLEREARALHG